MLAQTLNSMTADIQALRGDAESGLADAVATANNAMQKIAELNAPARRPRSPTARRTRRWWISATATSISWPQLMDIRVVQSDQNQVNVFTNSGVQLVGAERRATVLQCRKARSRAATQWDADPTKSTLGTLIAGVAERRHAST